mmetsp:Transcript_10942/g.20663  ORF Transcript_10942/g.20663 Transcript_10942/m.20663 type:complete len:110 (+) Transcript_10942:120-449(+)
MSWQLFCPTCGTFLFFDKESLDPFFYCKLCPYKYNIKGTIAHSVKLKKKQNELVLSKESEDIKGNKVEAVCPNCGHGEAQFQQMQTRSADEASTIIYRCCKCGHKWRED